MGHQYSHFMQHSETDQVTMKSAVIIKMVESII